MVHLFEAYVFLKMQCVVFLNMGNTAPVHVLCTTNHNNGEKNLYAEFLVDAQVLIGSAYFEAIAGVML
jgi:hypothetical protein